MGLEGGFSRFRRIRARSLVLVERGHGEHHTGELQASMIRAL